MEQSKRCSTCGHDLPVTAFYRDRRNRDGRYSECKACIRERRKRDRPRARAAERRYTARNLDKRRAASRDCMRRKRAKETDK